MLLGFLKSILLKKQITESANETLNLGALLALSFRGTLKGLGQKGFGLIEMTTVLMNSGSVS